jgi:predicted DCC family thiol-disulfide oxidoreductase YuxK
VNTEIPDDSGGQPTAWIAYDADCHLCVRLARMVQARLRRRGFELLPLQTPWVMGRLGLRPGDPLEEMKLLATDGTVAGGVQAVLELGRSIWWLRPLSWLASLPWGKRVLVAGYRWVARNRYCGNNSCVVPRPPRQVTIRHRQAKQQGKRHRRTCVFFEMP